MSFEAKAINALATLRHAAAEYGTLPVDVRWAINTLDEAGVFAALDEQTDYAAAEGILAESAIKDSAEALADFNAEYVAEQGGYEAASRLGKLERVPGTDTLVLAHEHAFRSPHNDEVCYTVEWCMVTYREHRLASVKIGYPDSCSCGGVGTPWGCTCG